MAVYHKDSALFFSEALDSLRPFSTKLESIVLVADGPLTNKLEKVILEKSKYLNIHLLKMPISKGLGEALNTGTIYSKSDYLLRMDSDDISRPERLDALLQLLFENPYLDVIGSQISEFDKCPMESLYVRRVPLTHEKIYRQMKARCAVNHVSCLLRRGAVVDVGGYSGGRGFAEDWWLWVRLLKNGAKFANLNQTLVDVRVGNGFIGRRQGWSMFVQDLRLIQMMIDIKFISWYHIIYLVPLRIIQRFSPSKILHLVYLIERKLGTKWK